MKNLTLLTNTTFKALFISATISMLLGLNLVAKESAMESKQDENAKHKPMSPVTNVAMTKCDNIKEFNPKQKEVLRFAYQFGSKENLGYELASIAWKESCAGTYRINFSDPSAGIYHAYIPSVLKSYGHKDSPFLRNVMGELLIQNHTFASEVALKELVYWKTRYQGNTKNMIKSYNKGSRWERNQKSNADAEKYYEDIQDKIRRLKESKIFDSHAKDDHKLQKSANSNLALDPIGDVMPQTLASGDKAPQTPTNLNSQVAKEIAKEQQEIKKIKELEHKPEYVAQANHTNLMPPKTKDAHKPKHTQKNTQKLAKRPHKGAKEVCKHCSKGQKNAILANRITLMQEP
ncbi:hypothetical protein [Helicobacter cetorum]|uniref:Transglycosylase SLT domain-containing protein n=1 Tax=Helicobacter cetorum (strain ATCC BAA-540 / CCUG 52418 / MIT 99-5656) TaxID=1163745 RepID=I0ETS2_HELCM|nr:hypothetical protein [Helicobacter cetorum]AFI06341.1 hypothetical protein HCD_06710 [Helicobacter cetorum MIT 99-5656]